MTSYYKKLISFFYKAFMILLGSLVITSVSFCHHPEKQKESIMTLQPATLSKSLYFSGTIQPLSQIPVVSPIEGIVSETFFKYGHDIKTGQLLCTINSSKQESNYETALTDYLKSKQKLISTQDKLKSTTDLFNQGLVSRNEYKSTKDEYSLDRLSFSQTKKRLEEILKQYQIKDLPKLSITDIQGIQKALALGKKSKSIKITASQSGVVLFSKDDKAQPGTKLEEGNVLLYVGDMTGISTEIEVTEININQLHEEQKATIIPTVSPQVSLNGYIKSISLQAAPEGNPPTFSVKIIVPSLTPEQREIIHVGMSAKVAILLSYTEQLTVPIKAVFQKDGHSFVKRINEKTKKAEETEVKTGETSEDSVMIISGLKAGDQIVVPH